MNVLRELVHVNVHVFGVAFAFVFCAIFVVSLGVGDKLEG